jgi:hypothetical protein
MPNQAHVHLLVNHFPIIGTFFSLLILLYAMLRRSSEGFRIACLVYVVSGIASVVTYLSGSGAAKVLKRFPEVVRSPIGPHADMGQLALIVTLTGAAFMLIVLVVSYLKDKTPGWMKLIVVLLQLASISILGYASHLGALVRHTEIDDSAVSISAPATSVPAAPQGQLNQQSAPQNH